jgi:hypothetical protein
MNDEKFAAYMVREYFAERTYLSFFTGDWAVTNLSNSPEEAILIKAYQEKNDSAFTNLVVERYFMLPDKSLKPFPIYQYEGSMGVKIS